VTCKEFASIIPEYLENELDGRTRAAFEQHLAICSNCLRYLTNYQATIVIGRKAFQVPAATLPPIVPEDLIRAILAAGGS
jgi:predicted anti-sigma-YlaC factor YlaD